LTGAISYGTLTAITQLISQIQSPFANISGYFPKFYAMTASAERLMDVERFEPDCSQVPKTLEEILEFYRNDLDKIGLDNVSFTYYPTSDKVQKCCKDTMPVVLQKLTLSVKKGEYAAFTGHSGCGKSTILKLLMCIYKPDAGARYLSAQNGEILDLNAAWHRLFAYVPQGNQLMSGTIREIVTFADKSAMHDDERIRKALEIACADDFVYSLENGLDTLLGERGTGLSEGQMQRIAVARAVFSESPIMMLDESTSALDELTESRMLQNLRSMTDKTVIIVTHRPAALNICDRIFRFSADGVEIEK
jgi:ATP-binding cassette subfamily B protein